MPRRIFHSIVVFSRTIHIYLTMFSFVLMIFLAITGITLNHEEWFLRNQPPPLETAVALPATLLTAPDSAGIVDHLRNVHGIRGALSTFDQEADYLRLVFRGPGRSAEAEIDRQAAFGDAEAAKDAAA